jgi:hypothetical protein
MSRVRERRLLFCRCTDGGKRQQARSAGGTGLLFFASINREQVVATLLPGPVNNQYGNFGC